MAFFPPRNYIDFSFKIDIITNKSGGLQWRNAENVLLRTKQNRQANVSNELLGIMEH